MMWEIKLARAPLVDSSTEPSQPTDRQYWLIVAHNPKTKEYKYFVSNAPKKTRLEDMLRAAFARWHVEMWFERAKQETGLGAFEVRTYQSLIRHWLCSRIAMYFLATQTERLRGGKIRGSHWSRWRRQRTTWPRRSGTATGVRRLTGPALRNTTRTVMRPHTRADAGRPRERKRDSAVILARRRH